MAMPKQLDPIILARKRLIFKLAEKVAGKTDIDQIRKIIDMWLPQTYAEAQVELDRIGDTDEMPKERRPSPAIEAMDKMRGLLGFNKDDSLIMVVQAAANKLSELLRK